MYFKPTCSEKEKDYLLLTNKILIGEKYSIDRVINHFYVILQDYAGGLTNPIRFSDISKEWTEERCEYTLAENSIPGTNIVDKLDGKAGGGREYQTTVPIVPYRCVEIPEWDVL